MMYINQYTHYYEKMNPVYDFIGTTNSTKITKKIKDRDIQKNRGTWNKTLQKYQSDYDDS